MSRSTAVLHVFIVARVLNDHYLWTMDYECQSSSNKILLDRAAGSFTGWQFALLSIMAKLDVWSLIVTTVQCRFLAHSFSLSFCERQNMATVFDVQKKRISSNYRLCSFHSRQIYSKSYGQIDVSRWWSHYVACSFVLCVDDERSKLLSKQIRVSERERTVSWPRWHAAEMSVTGSTSDCSKVRHKWIQCSALWP